MKRLFTLFVSIVFISSISFAQAREEEPDNIDGLSFKDRLYTGGNLGLSFGTFTFVDVSPILGYRITKDFSAGIGAKYIYSAFNGTPRTSVSMYGGSLFSRYLFLENFLAHTEFEMINMPLQQPFTGEVKREWIPIGLVGGGYRQGFGNSYFQIMLLYDLIGDERNPYVSPFGPQSRLYLRTGITISF